MNVTFTCASSNNCTGDYIERILLVHPMWFLIKGKRLLSQHRYMKETLFNETWLSRPKPVTCYSTDAPLNSCQSPGRKCIIRAIVKGHSHLKYAGCNPSRDQFILDLYTKFDAVTTMKASAMNTPTFDWNKLEKTYEYSCNYINCNKPDSSTSIGLAIVRDILDDNNPFL